MTSAETIPATSPASPRSELIAGIDLLTLREREADHQVLNLVTALTRYGATGIVAATHWATVGVLRHVSLSVEFTGIDFDAAWAVLADRVADTNGPSGLLLGERYAGQPELRQVLEETVAAHLTRSSGRLVTFPGSDALVGALTVAEALRCSALDRVHVLAGADAPDTALLLTRGFVRPRWARGLLSLDVQAAAGGTLVPFETPTPTPCCVSHC